MKTKANFLPISLLVLINICFLLSSYWFPVTRDEFYYLDKSQLPYVFSEYWTSYNYVNPRIGQFFLNIVARSDIFRLIFGFLLFNGFFIALFANVFRRLPKISEKKDVWSYLILVAAFIFLINYFGELFYYSPFATNYTFTHVLYLFYLYAMTEYFVFQKNVLPKSGFKMFLICILAFITGMGNEHVPPVLILFSTLFGFVYIFKNKKLPDFKIIITNIVMGFGYLALFFAPANAVKYDTVGKTQYGFSFHDYTATLKMILKFYYYYNSALIIAFVAAFAGVLYLIKKKKILNKELVFISSLVSLAVLAILIISYSPLTGTRLMFFSTVSCIIIVCYIFKKLGDYFKINVTLAKGVALCWILIFFALSTLICFHGNSIYNKLTAEISEKSKASADVVLDERLDYFKNNFSIFNRRILFENGTEYIDQNPQKNTSEEKNLIKYFNLKTLSHQ